MLTQLRAIFDLIIQFQMAQESFFSVATTELQSRQRLEKAIVTRTDEVRTVILAKAINYSFLVKITAIDLIG